MPRLRRLAALALGLTLASGAQAQDFGGFRRGGEPGSFDF
jgi:ribonuclease T2